MKQASKCSEVDTKEKRKEEKKFSKGQNPSESIFEISPPPVRGKKPPPKPKNPPLNTERNTKKSYILRHKTDKNVLPKNPPPYRF